MYPLSLNYIQMFHYLIFIINLVIIIPLSLLNLVIRFCVFKLMIFCYGPWLPREMN